MNRSGIATLLETVPLLEKPGNQSSVDMPDSSDLHSNHFAAIFPMFLALVHLLQAQPVPESQFHITFRSSFHRNKLQ